MDVQKTQGSIYQNASVKQDPCEDLMLNIAQRYEKIVKLGQVRSEIKGLESELKSLKETQENSQNKITVAEGNIKVLELRNKHLETHVQTLHDKKTTNNNKLEVLTDQKAANAKKQEYLKALLEKKKQETAKQVNSPQIKN